VSDVNGGVFIPTKMNPKERLTYLFNRYAEGLITPTERVEFQRMVGQPEMEQHIKDLISGESAKQLLIMAALNTKCLPKKPARYLMRFFQKRTSFLWDHNSLLKTK